MQNETLLFYHNIWTCQNSCKYFLLTDCPTKKKHKYRKNEYDLKNRIQNARPHRHGNSKYTYNIYTYTSISIYMHCYGTKKTPPKPKLTNKKILKTNRKLNQTPRLPLFTTNTCPLTLDPFPFRPNVCTQQQNCFLLNVDPQLYWNVCLN